MQLDHIKRIYFIGIGGIGMSALARYFKSRSVIVSGYDRTETELTDQLQKEGIEIHFDDNLDKIDKAAELIIYTPAIPKTHAEYNFYLNNNYPLYKRSQILGFLSKEKFTIAVAGSHGKTTVSSMIAWILKHSGYDCSAFLGGISSNFQSNFISGDNDVMIAEADEFDRSFLQLSPNIAVITAVDSDHLEIYGSQESIEDAFTEFANKVEIGGTVIAKSSITILKNFREKTFKYSLHDINADLHVAAFNITLSGSQVELSNGMQYLLKYPGIHNIENSVAASLVAIELGIAPELISAALNEFAGVHRRFEMIFNNHKTVFIDDYAHHPEEIRMFLYSIKEIYKGKKVCAIFQPHLFTRTRDLADGFAASLDQADEIILLPIYPAREEPIEGITAEIILNKITNPNKKLLSKTELLDYIGKNQFEVICTIGAGDIDKLIKPIAALLGEK
jgi:UDP-N-acetylmuramate--alanine ligase